MHCFNLISACIGIVVLSSICVVTCDDNETHNRLKRTVPFLQGSGNGVRIEQYNMCVHND